MFKKISARKISDEIIEQFKELISKGELKPGDELPSEREMAESIGVSRPPLREALNALKTMGFVEIKPRSKIVIKSITGKSLEEPISQLIENDIEKVFELLEIRRALEGWVASLATVRATVEEIANLKQIITKDQKNFMEERDDAKTDADFHMAIAKASHNTLVTHLISTWYNLLWKTQRMARKKIFRHKGNRQTISNQHLAIFKAIEAGDKDMASRTAREHVDFVDRELRRILSEEAA